MNYDRFLTRVWDKEEKKMLYFDDKFKIPSKKDFEHTFLGITSEGIVVQRDYYNPNICGEVSCKTDIIPFGDRFVPMQCWGLLDKNKKLIYDDDVIKFENGLYLCSFTGFSFGLSSIKEACNIFVPTPLTRKKSEVIGNQWENPELMEEDK